MISLPSKMFRFSIFKIGVITITGWIPWQADSEMGTSVQHGVLFGSSPGEREEGAGRERKEEKVKEGRKQDQAAGEGDCSTASVKAPANPIRTAL